MTFWSSSPVTSRSPPWSEVMTISVGVPPTSQANVTSVFGRTSTVSLPLTVKLVMIGAVVPPAPAAVSTAITGSDRDLGLSDGFTTVAVAYVHGHGVTAVFGIAHTLRPTAGGRFAVAEVPSIAERITVCVFGGSCEIYRQRGVAHRRHRSQRDARRGIVPTVATPDRNLRLGRSFAAVTVGDGHGRRITAVCGIGDALGGPARCCFTVAEIPGVVEGIPVGVGSGRGEVYRERSAACGRNRAQ